MDLHRIEWRTANANSCRMPLRPFLRDIVVPQSRADAGRKGAICLLAGLMLLTAALYATGLRGPFMYDDAFNLAPVLSWARDLTPWQDVVFGNPSGLLGRPVSMLSFLLTGFAGVDPWHFKFGNLLLHLVTGLLVWQFLRRLFRLDARLTSQADLLAACAAGLWSLHPLHANTVLYAVQCMALLGALFTIAALLSYLSARELMDSGDQRRGLLRLYVATPLLVLMGLLSKE